MVLELGALPSKFIAFFILSSIIHLMSWGRKSLCELKSWRHWHKCVCFASKCTKCVCKPCRFVRDWRIYLLSDFKRLVLSELDLYSRQRCQNVAPLGGSVASKNILRGIRDYQSAKQAAWVYTKEQPKANAIVNERLTPQITIKTRIMAAKSCAPICCPLTWSRFICIALQIVTVPGWCCCSLSSSINKALSGAASHVLIWLVHFPTVSSAGGTHFQWTLSSNAHTWRICSGSRQWPTTTFYTRIGCSPLTCAKCCLVTPLLNQ